MVAASSSLLCGSDLGGPVDEGHHHLSLSLKRKRTPMYREVLGSARRNDIETHEGTLSKTPSLHDLPACQRASET